MQVTKNSHSRLGPRRAVRETFLLCVVFLIALTLFFVTLHFIAAKEADHELEKRPRGLLLGWLTTITIGLLLGRARQERAVSLPKSLVVIRESLQAAMLLLFFAFLSYGSYFVYTSRALIVHRPWGLLIGWFAFLVFIVFFVKTRHLICSVRRK